MTRLRNGKKVKPDRIHEALELLNQAARDKQHELYEALGNRYDDIKHVLSNYAEQGRSTIRQVRERADAVIHTGEEKIKEAANGVKTRVQAVDSKVHEKPWLFMGGIALGSFLLGMAARASRRQRSSSAK